MRHDRRLRSALRHAALCALALGSLALPSAGLADGDTLHGPGFGKSRYDAAIVSQSEGGTEQDTDLFVQPLLRGESFKAAVKAARKSALSPGLTVLVPGENGPPTELADADLKTAKNGRKVVLRTTEAARTGDVGLRVFGQGGSEGAYTAKLKVKGAKPIRLRRQVFDEENGTSVRVPFDALPGSRLDAVLKWSSKGEAVSVLRVERPDGRREIGVLGAIRTKRNKTTIEDVDLLGDAGEYGLLLGIEEGRAEWSLTLVVTPPERPRGRVTLEATEAFVRPVDEPLEARVGDVVGIPTRNVTVPPAPSVYLGGVRAQLNGVAPGGGTVAAVVPEGLAPDTLVSVEVLGADGQGVCRAGHLLVLPPREPDPDPDVEIASISPPEVALEGTQEQGFQVTLDGVAPDGGALVTLEATGGIGTVPPSVIVSAGQTTAGFVLTAADVTTTGQVRATLGPTVAADVSVTKKPVVDPDDRIDVSGWALHQASSTRTFTFPEDTVLTEGDVVIVARNVGKAEFEAFWGVTLGSNVHFFTSVDHGGPEWPSVNGSERYSLDDETGTTVDGQTIAMRSSAHRNYQRTPGTDAGVAESWTESVDTVANASPGTVPTATGSDGGNGVYVSEFTDAPGSGSFPNEFVELYFDGLPD